MELNTNTNYITVKKAAFETAVEQQLESDITLPEYFPDIVRVLRCSVTPNVSVTNVTGDRVTAEGNAVLSVLYLSDDRKLHCFEQRIPYSRFIESKDVEGSCIYVRARTEYVNCRVVSQRRMDIHACISISFKGYRKNKQGMISSCDDGGTQLKKEAVTMSNLRDCCEKNFTVSETLEIGASMASIGQIVSSEASVIIEDTKIVAGKILIKGELNIKTLYLSENDCELQKTENSMPVSQIVEVDIAEDSTDIVNLSVASIEVFAKTDSSGALRLIDLTAVIKADIDIYQDVDTQCITDCYSTQYELECTRENIEVRQIAEKFNDTYLCRGTVDLTGSNIGAVHDITCTGVTAVAEIADNEMKICGTVTVNMIISDADGEFICTERQFNYEYKRTVASGGQGLECSPFINVTGTGFVLGAENKVDIRVEVDISAVIFKTEVRRAITVMTADEDKIKVRKAASLTIYFAEEGEKVWDIARRYNTTVEAVKTENRLTNDILSENCKLLIPSA